MVFDIFYQFIGVPGKTNLAPGEGIGGLPLPDRYQCLKGCSGRVQLLGSIWSPEDDVMHLHKPREHRRLSKQQQDEWRSLIREAGLVMRPLYGSGPTSSELLDVPANYGAIPPTGPAQALKEAEAAHDHERVIALLESQLRYNPSDWTAMHRLSTTLVRVGRGREALQYRIAVCDMFARDGFFKHARGLLQQVEHIDPDNPDVRSRLDAWAGK